MLGPFEHQMLEEMRKAGTSRPLVLGADVIPDVHRHDRHVMVLVDDHVETVGERALRVGKIDGGHGSALGSGLWALGFG